MPNVYLTHNNLDLMYREEKIRKSFQKEVIKSVLQKLYDFMSYDSGNSSNKMITYFGLNGYSSHSSHQEKLEQWLQQEISEVYLHDISQEEVVESLWKKILDIISH